MKELPLEDRPRERLEKWGDGALTLSELIAILLGTGTRKKSAIELAEELVLRFKDLNGIIDASTEELSTIKGIGKAKALRLKAAFAIAKRSRRSTSGQAPKMLQARHAFELLRDELILEKREMLYVLLRDVRGKLITCERVATGTLSEVLVHPREVFHPAIRHNAYGVIIAHNHPSGDPTPSLADLKLTRVLCSSALLLGLSLDDHVIIGGDSYLSLREAGYFGDRTVRGKERAAYRSLA